MNFNAQPPRTASVSLVVVLVTLLAVPAAFAHAHPVAMLPAPDQTVPSPDVVKISFSEAVEPKFSKISVMDAAGHGVNKEVSMVGADAKTISVALPKLAAGVYTVNWIAVAVDSHREQGSYKFSVK
jgi:methionine-rich copper-binding protein CopC